MPEIKSINKEHIEVLDAKITDLRKKVKDFSKFEDDSLAEILRHIHIPIPPGWTTPAEYRLTLAIIEATALQMKILGDLNTALTEASRSIAKSAG